MEEEKDELQKVAQSLRAENRLFDITLRTDEGEIACHRFVLVAHSAYFNDLLQGSQQFCTLLDLTECGVPHQVIQALVEWMYTGSLELAETDAPSVLQGAHCLQMQKAVTYINEHYIQHHASVPQVKLTPQKSQGKKRGRPKKCEAESKQEDNPYKEGVASLSVEHVGQAQVDAIMTSSTGRARRASSLRLAALMHSLKQDEPEATAAPGRVFTGNTYSRVTSNAVSHPAQASTVSMEEDERESPPAEGSSGVTRAHTMHSNQTSPSHQRYAILNEPAGSHIQPQDSQVQESNEDTMSSDDLATRITCTPLPEQDTMATASEAVTTAMPSETDALYKVQGSRLVSNEDQTEYYMVDSSGEHLKACGESTEEEIPEEAVVAPHTYAEEAGDNCVSTTHLNDHNALELRDMMDTSGTSKVMADAADGMFQIVTESDDKEDITMHVEISVKSRTTSPSREDSGISDDEPDAKKKRYVIPRNTLNFLKKNKLLYKMKPEEAEEKDREGGGTERKRKYRRGGLLRKYEREDQPGVYVCPWQGCTFTSRHSKNVYVHEKRHTGERPWSCPECDKTFISRKHMVLHQSVHSDQRPFMCAHCNKSFRAQSGLDRHQLTHTGEKPWACTWSECGAAFADKVNLKKHIAMVHMEQRPFECDHPGCQYVAYDKAALDRHSRRHQQLTERESEQCNVCGKVLYGKYSMQSHMLLHEGKAHCCPYCEYSSVFKQALQAHCYRKHGLDLEGKPAERSFRCNQCDFATFWEHELKFHLVKHTGLRPYQCPICDYSTVLKGSLVKHMRLHTGETPFRCDVCNKAYTNQSGLARHKRTHTGEKPHKCEFCGKRYADLKTMRTHRYSHLNVKPYTCNVCQYTCTKKDVLLAHYRKMHNETEVPDSYKPKPTNKVLMRVTSGQTADEIIRNIAPSGQGDRQFVVINREKENAEANNKFLVIQEDDAPRPMQPVVSEDFTHADSQLLLQEDPNADDYHSKVIKIANAAERPTYRVRATPHYATIPELLESLRAQYPDLQCQSVEAGGSETLLQQVPGLPGLVLVANPEAGEGAELQHTEGQVQETPESGVAADVRMSHPILQAELAERAGTSLLESGLSVFMQSDSAPKPGTSKQEVTVDETRASATALSKPSFVLNFPSDSEGDSKGGGGGGKETNMGTTFETVGEESISANSYPMTGLKDENGHVTDSNEFAVGSQLTAEQLKEISQQITACHAGDEIVFHVPESGALPAGLADNLQLAGLDSSGQYLIAYVDQPGEQVDT